MPKVIFDISMSLDGYTTADPNPKGGMGEGGDSVHEWAFASKDPKNAELLARGGALGAIIAGRTTFDISIDYWKENGPTGAARVPIIVLTHEAPHDLPKDHVYTFVNNVADAAENAKQVAGKKDVAVMGGENIARQFLDAGLLDEVSVHIAPVLFGRGKRLFGEFDGKHVKLEPIEVINTKEAVHLRYRVIK
jgi:dihydrofolate reductase